MPADLPPVVRLVGGQCGYHVKLLLRNPRAMVAGAVMPVVLLVLRRGEAGNAVDVAGLLVLATTLTAYVTHAIAIVTAREEGVLRRWRGAPLPPACFIAGRTLATVLTAVLNAGAAMVAAIALAGVDVWPASAAATLVVLTAGALTWALVGTAVSGLIDRAEGAWPTLALSYLPLMAVSGVFGPPSGPAWLTTIAGGLPAAPFVHAVDAALGGDALPAARDVTVLAAWAAIALVVSLRTFRWLPHQR